MTLSSSEARLTLIEACREVSLPAEKAELIRIGENAIYRVGDTVVRIARSESVLPDVEKEVAVAAWLHDAGVPAAEPDRDEQPIIVRGHPVTFWKLIKDSGRKAGLTELGRVLQVLHGLEVPESLKLPEFDIFGRVAERIQGADHLPETDRDFFQKRLFDLRSQYEQLSFPLPPAAVHGDAHVGNIMITPQGVAFLIDFERFAFGPPESDLAVTGTETLIGWHSRQDYAKFADSYGFDIISWDGFPVLRAINEIKMTTWLMQNVAEGEHVQREYEVRLSSLRNQDAPRPWSPF